MKWRGPDFVIAGTQKAGTTWLEKQLNSHPEIYTPEKQLHYFDKHYDLGEDWYKKWFRHAEEEQLTGEKTTEYFDNPIAQAFAQRISRDCPNTKVIVILREPVSRTLSALRHMVNSGLVKKPADPDQLLFKDRERPQGKSYRYIERGFYAEQLRQIQQYVAQDNLLVLIFEDDIIANPENGLEKTFAFLGVSSIKPQHLDKPVNQLRLSPLGAYLSRKLYVIPYARGIIRRLDNWLHLPPWKPQFKQETIAELHSIFREPNEELYEIIGRRITRWSKESTTNKRS